VITSRPNDEALTLRDLLGLGGLLVGCVVGCTALGLLVDYLTGWSPAGVLTGIALGLVLAAAGFVVRVRKVVVSQPPDE
jgi:hypothetical protein